VSQTQEEAQRIWQEEGLTEEEVAQLQVPQKSARCRKRALGAAKEP